MAGESGAVCPAVIHAGAIIVGLVVRGTRSYYYTSRRVGGRVVTRYAGSGECAVLMARSDAIRRSHREAETATRATTAAAARSEFADLRAQIAAMNSAVAAALRASGWHQHRREWRKKRGTTMTLPLATIDATGTWVSAELSAAAGKLSPEQSQQARAGDRAAVPAVNAYLANPAATALWGDLGRHLTLKLIRLHVGNDVLLETATIKFASELRGRLAGPNSTPLELLVAERVVVAWLFVNWAENQYASLVREGTTYRDAEFQLKRIGLAKGTCRVGIRVDRRDNQQAPSRRPRCDVSLPGRCRNSSPRYLATEKRRIEGRPSGHR